MNTADLIATLDRHASEYREAGQLDKAEELAAVAREVARKMGADPHTRGAIKVLFIALRDDDWPKRLRITEIKRLYPDVPSKIVAQIVDGHDKAADAEYALWCEIIRDLNNSRN